MNPFLIILAFVILAVMIVGGLAAFLKLKKFWYRVLGMVSFGVGLALLLGYPLWLIPFPGPMP